MEKLGKYQLLKKLATGGMAEVFLARSEGARGFAKTVVVKRILPQFVEDARFVEMFLGEATIAAHMNHPNVVQVFDFGEADGQYYLAMEYIDGPNLRGLDKALRMKGQQLSIAQACRIVAFAAEGLQYAHDLLGEDGQPFNLVHRDISPDNVMLSRSGAVKVVDFGIAKPTTGIHQTRSGMVKGKLAYMPPEQLAREALDRRTDVFALGVVLFELVAGGMPFNAESEVSIIQAIMDRNPFQRLAERVRDVPAALDGILAKCLAKNANDRYPSMKALQADLEAFLQTQPPVATSELATLVRENFAPLADPAVTSRPSLSPVATPEPTTEEAYAATQQRESLPQAQPVVSAAAPAPLAPPVDAGPQVPGLDRTELSTRTVQTKRTKTGAIVAAVVGAGLIVAVALAWPRATTTAAVDAGSSVAPVPTTVKPPEVAVPPVVTPDAAVPVVDAGAVEVAKPPDVPKPPDVVKPDVVKVDRPKPPVAAAKATLELRIRPFAKVFLDGKELGETPLDPQQVSVGAHKLRLVNAELGKDVVVDVQVPAEGTVFKYNLKE